MLYNDALGVNTRVHNLPRTRIEAENAPMHKDGRTTVLATVMAAYDGGRGMSDNELARRAKVPQPTVSRIASGKTKNPDETTLDAIAKVLNVSTRALRGLEPIHGGKKADGSHGLSPEALEVARAWSKLPDYKQKGYAQGIMVDAAVCNLFPQIERAMRLAAQATNPTYHKMTEKFMRAKEQLERQFSLDLEAKSDP